jgi:hypothetical protein
MPQKASNEFTTYFEGASVMGEWQGVAMDSLKYC